MIQQTTKCGLMALGTLCINIVFLDHSYYISSVFLLLYLFWYVVLASIIVSCCNFLWPFSTNKNLTNRDVIVINRFKFYLHRISALLCRFHKVNFNHISEWHLSLNMKTKYTKHCLNSYFVVKMILPISYFDYGTH